MLGFFIFGLQRLYDQILVCFRKQSRSRLKVARWPGPPSDKIEKNLQALTILPSIRSQAWLKISCHSLARARVNGSILSIDLYKIIKIDQDQIYTYII